MAMFRKDWLGDVMPISETLVLGRVTRTLLDDGWCTTVVYNVHNFGLTALDVRNISKRIRADLAAMESDPTRHNVIIAGDWNFCPDDETNFDLNNPDTDFATDPTSRTQHATLWTQTLAPLTDINATRRQAESTASTLRHQAGSSLA